MENSEVKDNKRKGNKIYCIVTLFILYCIYLFYIRKKRYSCEDKDNKVKGNKFILLFYYL